MMEKFQQLLKLFLLLKKVYLCKMTLLVLLWVNVFCYLYYSIYII